METADKITQTLAKNIALLRRQNGMTQLELAEKLSYSDKAISKWERGEAIPDVIVLVQLSELFNVSLSDLVSTDLSTEKELQSLTKEKKKRTLLNKWIIALMSSGLVWLIATITFVLINYTEYDSLFFSFYLRNTRLLYRFVGFFHGLESFLGNLSLCVGFDLDIIYFCISYIEYIYFHSEFLAIIYYSRGISNFGDFLVLADTSNTKSPKEKI